MRKLDKKKKYNKKLNNQITQYNKNKKLNNQIKSFSKNKKLKKQKKYKLNKFKQIILEVQAVQNQEMKK